MGFHMSAGPQPTLTHWLLEQSVADKTDNVLFREIEDELRKERAKKLWKNYGRYIIATAVALVIGVAGYQGWRTYDISSRTADGERFAAALKLAADNHSEQAATAFANISQDAVSGYAMLSRFREAGLLVSSGCVTADDGCVWPGPGSGSSLGSSSGSGLGSSSGSDSFSVGVS